MRALRFVASYSSTPKPRRGHRRVSGGGSVSGAEPLLVGVTTPPVAASGISSAAGASAKKTGAQKQNPQKASSQKATASAQPLTPEERERLEWMRQQRPPHWGNNIV
ncbi:Uncharacterised protein [Mycobacterium tuberculosis]|nr:Uncharacterised protein [Mycobacterium tuberculosis]